MEDHSESVMIALLPITTDWCKIALPHMTLVYAGEKKDLSVSARNEMAKDAAFLARTTAPIGLEVAGQDLFGSEDDVRVLLLKPNAQLLGMRQFVARWNASEHPFTPHVTVGPREVVVDTIPSIIAFDRILFAAGEEKITFHMKEAFDSQSLT